MFKLKSFLNESLQSTTLYNEILNEPGGFFKYALPENNMNNIGEYQFENKHSLYKTALDSIEHIRAIINALFGYNANMPENNEKNAYTSTKGLEERIQNLEKIKNLNKMYNKYFKQYIYCTEHLFDRPNPLIFAELIKHLYIRVPDIFNIQDGQFKKYTYTELRKNPDVFKKAISNENNIVTSVIFWFNGETKKLLAISKTDKIVAYGLGIHINNDRIAGQFPYNASLDTPEKLKGVIDIDKIILEPRIDILSDGTKLTWPRSVDFCSDYYYYNAGLSSLNRDDKIKIFFPHKRIQNRFRRKGPNEVFYTIGNPFVNTSNILKFTGWGKNDYVIIYTPLQWYHSEKNTSQIEYNLSLHSAPSRMLRRLDFYASSDYQRYKWSVDIEGKIMPYSIDGERYIYSVDPETGKITMSKLPNSTRGYVNYGDAYRALIKKENNDRYTLKKTTMYTKKIIEPLETATNKIVNDIIPNYIAQIEELRGSLLKIRKFPTITVDRVQIHINKMLISAQYCKYALYQIKSLVDSTSVEGTAERTRQILEYRKSFTKSMEEFNTALENLQKILDSDEIKKYLNL